MSRLCGACGAEKTMAPFKGKTFVIGHAGLKRTVRGLSGWRCGECGEVVFDAASAKRYAGAGDALVLKDRERKSVELKRIRQKLGLSQREASVLTGGGHNAFSRYERGEAAPVAAAVNLFRVLDKHPELLKDRELDLLAAASSDDSEKRKGETVQRGKGAKRRMTVA